MQNSPLNVRSPENRVDPSLFAPTRRTSAVSTSLTRILLVQFRNGEAVDRHPELKALIDDGWSIRSAVPRIVEAEGTKLLVVLGKPPAPGTRAAAVRSRDRTKKTQLAGS